MNIKQLLDRFDEYSRTASDNGLTNGSADRALYVLLDAHRDKLPLAAESESFHKQFRTPGVTGCRVTDDVIWLLLEQSVKFWVFWNRFH